MRNKELDALSDAGMDTGKEVARILFKEMAGGGDMSFMRGDAGAGLRQARIYRSFKGGEDDLAS